jgi:teichuronic acid biosynthesis glycosyltransferase TuaG
MQITISAIKYSVIIPYYNKVKQFERCLISLLEQDFKNFEVIIIDDASFDDVSFIIDEYRKKFSLLKVPFKFIRLSDNKGPSFARNVGIKESDGVYLAFLDADDLWHKQKLSIVNKFIDEFKPCLIANKSSTSFEDYNMYYHNSDFTILKYSRPDILFKNIATTPSIIIKNRTNYFFDEFMRYSEDYDLWLRIILFQKDIYIIEGPPLTYLGRPVLSVGGASSSKFKMRIGEIYTYIKLLKSKYIFLVPFLILLSIVKHIYMLIRNYSNLYLKWK